MPTSQNAGCKERFIFYLLWLAGIAWVLFLLWFVGKLEFIGIENPAIQGIVFFLLLAMPAIFSDWQDLKAWYKKRKIRRK